ncbi:hypothetical protein [Acinetobacter sp. TUM15113]|uniref:hypothetical protein n=1 Tax=Acinetobacter sp. TUM15113 TaxID=2609140 RepID=UPI00124C28F3|nr:hypothetical protein [Acinetobacter sp. TUM15113]
MTLRLNVSKFRNTNGVWSGMPITEAKIYYDRIYSLGNLSSLHYGVWLEPYDENGKIAQETIELIDSYDLSHQEAGSYNAFEKGEQGYLAGTVIENIPLMDNSRLPWLCQSLDLSLLDAQTDSVHVGAFQLNHITGNSSGEISIPFIETRNAAIMNSALAIKEIMFPGGDKGGTQALLTDYLMKMTIYIYDRHSFSTRVFEVQHLVALQTGSIPLDATNRNGVGVVTLNFIKMFPMLK